MNAAPKRNAVVHRHFDVPAQTRVGWLPRTLATSCVGAVVHAQRISVYTLRMLASCNVAERTLSSSCREWAFRVTTDVTLCPMCMMQM